MQIDKKPVECLELQEYIVMKRPQKIPPKSGYRFENPGYLHSEYPMEYMEFSTFKACPEPKKSSKKVAFRIDLEDEYTKPGKESFYSTKPVNTYENVFIPPPDYENMTPSYKSDAYEEFSLDELFTTPEVESKFDEPNNSAVSENIKKFEEILLNDKTLSMIKKLKFAKIAFTFFEYTFFVTRFIYHEVSGYAFLDVYYFLSGLYLLFLGIFYRSMCQTSYFIFLVISFAIVALLASVVKLSITSCNAQKKTSPCISLLVSILRLFMTMLSMLGVYQIYIHYPPELTELSNSDFCPPPFYWSAFYIFTLSNLICAAVLFHGILLILWYCI